MREVVVRDTIQKGYRYTRSAPMGKRFAPDFTPDLTPKEMLRLGVFGGVYLNDCKKEFPATWFEKARLSSGAPDKKHNLFLVDASQSLSIWQQKGWIYADDPRGWFQWYARYYMGRRIPKEDARQIRRWKAIRRHIGQLRAHCMVGDLSCRPVQRQALLHWAYDSRKL